MRDREMQSTRFCIALIAWVWVLVTANAAIAQQADDSLVQDAQQYAAEFGVDLDEALYRLELQPAIGQLEAELSANEQATYAGLWIQHTPIYLVVVQFTQGGGAHLESYLEAAGREELARHVELRTVELPLAKLAAIRAFAHRLAQDNRVPADTHVNVIENRVDLLTTDPEQISGLLAHAERTQVEAAELQVFANVEVRRVDRLMKPEAYVYAGLSLSTCTSAFGVQNGSGTRGVLTAGHCGSSQLYNTRSLPFQAEAYSGSSDVQWHTAPGLHVTNRIYDGINDSSTPLYRLVTATKLRASQAIGEYVCKYGMTTAYTCGTITSKTYQPSYVPSANATFIYVSGGTVNLSEPGDSGGPWFSGSTAYGVHSGGGGNDAIYTAIDYISPLGVSVLTTTPLVTAGRWTYRATGDNIYYYTGINAAEYECGIAGLAARDGDIQEHDAGNIIQTYLYKDYNHWRIRGEFRTHNNNESWDVDLLCLKKSSFAVSRYEYNNLGDNISYNTNLSTTTYDCGVAGIAAMDGDIEEHDDGDIIKSYLYPSSGKWWIRADFRTHNNHESWDVDLLCVEKSASVVRYEYNNLGDNIYYNTGISTSTYVCGVAGMAAIDGDIQENDTGDIIQVYLYESAGTWRIRADFRTHNDSESWDVDLLCVKP